MRIGCWAGWCGAVALAGLCGCAFDAQSDEAGQENLGRESEQLAACPSGASCVTTALGNLTVRYYTCSWSGSTARNRKACTVDSDFVLVGGGAEIRDDGQPGALLTGSYPDGDSWWAESKDHVASYPHRTRAYAIGLRLAGLTKSQLQQSVTTVARAMGPTAHPSIKFVPPAGQLILSGGAQTQYVGSGQLLTTSTLSGTGWIAASKDHVQSDPGYVTVYVTTIKDRPTGSSIRLATDYTVSQSISSGGGYRSVTTINVDDSLVTGIGAAAIGTNRLLTDAFPVSQARGGGTVNTKDHVTPANGSAELTLARLREL